MIATSLVEYTDVEFDKVLDSKYLILTDFKPTRIVIVAAVMCGRLYKSSAKLD